MNRTLADNAERVPPPRGRNWNASTINGNRKRGNGLLLNPLYAGKLVWNKVMMPKDPATGKRVIRPNPKSAWKPRACPTWPSCRKICSRRRNIGKAVELRLSKDSVADYGKDSQLLRRRPSYGPCSVNTIHCTSPNRFTFKSYITSTYLRAGLAISKSEACGCELPLLQPSSQYDWANELSFTQIFVHSEREDWRESTLEGRFGDLSLLTDRQLADLFHQRRNDPQFLEALNEELKTRDSDEATDLHIEVIKARRAFAQAPPEPAQLDEVRLWLRTFFETRDLKSAGGLPLYRYRMSDPEYEKAKTILRHLAGSRRLANPDLHAGAMFVAFGAEWFRRESASTFLRWDELARISHIIFARSRGLRDELIRVSGTCSLVAPEDASGAGTLSGLRVAAND